MNQQQWGTFLVKNAIKSKKTLGLGNFTNGRPIRRTK